MFRLGSKDAKTQKIPNGGSAHSENYNAKFKYKTQRLYVLVYRNSSNNFHSNKEHWRSRGKHIPASRNANRLVSNGKARTQLRQR